MDFLELFDVSERYLNLVNPTSPEKIIKLGKFLRLQEGSRVIDFGCGYAEPLLLWAENFGIVATGIDIREAVCERARSRVSERGFADRIEIVCGLGADYEFEDHAYDAATCIGASFVWGGYRLTVRAMSRAIHPRGRLGIGEPYWLRENVPEEYAEREKSVHSEYELLQVTREEGFDFEYVVRANRDDWDRYEADNWYGLVRWLEDNPDHPERGDVIERLRGSQDEYMRYGREFIGWAMYVLTPGLVT